MNRFLCKKVSLVFLILAIVNVTYGQADPTTYLMDTKNALQKKWPRNRTVNIVFHGHSVPSGYFRTPEVHTLEAYPFLLLQALKKRYPYAVINCITTSIGGENSVQGAKRFKKEVLTHHPDVLCIDYALNDRGVGLDASRRAMEQMIRMALKKNIKIILMTPSPDLTEDIKAAQAPLNQFSTQLKQLAAKYHIGLADSYQAFKSLVLKGETLKEYMAQSNHPNEKGHEIILSQLLPFF